MGYKAYGVIIEGIWCDPLLTTPAILGGGIVRRDQPVTIGLLSYRFKPDILAAAPQLSSTDLDVFTGQIKTGSINIKLNAIPAVTEIFLGQNITRRPDLVSTSDVSATASNIEFNGTPVIGAFYYFGEEIIRIEADLGSGVYQVMRGCGTTPITPHYAGDGLYSKPNYWIGRTVRVVVIDFNDNFNPEINNTPASVKTVWQGVLSAAPQNISGTTQIELKADHILSTFINKEINRAPFTFSTGISGLAYKGGNSEVVLNVQTKNDDVSNASETRVYKSDFYKDTVRLRAMQVENSLAVDVAGNIFSPAELHSPAFIEGEWYSGPFYELAVWNKELDAYYLAVLNKAITPTFNCEYPYHPLTVAAALLFSTQDPNISNPSHFDVMHPQFSVGISHLMDLNAWQEMIRATPGIEIDQLVLGWNGESVNVFETISKKLLPAYGFALTASDSGLISPISVGIVDIETYVQAPSIEPLPEYWEWKNTGSEVLDQIIARIGDTPWAQGTAIAMNGASVRNDISGRSSRTVDVRKVEYNYPTISASNAQSFSLSNLLNILAWRFDGLPQVTLRLPMTAALHAGQHIKMLKPNGLITPILYDFDGKRVDDWGHHGLVGQIVSLRPVIDSQYYEAKILLPNYIYGELAKFRAPACRIKQVLGGGQYLIEGATSDFADDGSDAYQFVYGDQIEFYSPALTPFGAVATVQSVITSGTDVTITLDVTISPDVPVGTWIVLASSPYYENPSRYGAEFPYPFVFMTDGPTLSRPGGVMTGPDEFT